MILDADHFKHINDNHGHAAGDRALQALCNCAVGSLRENDLLARYGGEELSVLLPDTDQALYLAKTSGRNRVCTTPARHDAPGVAKA